MEPGHIHVAGENRLLTRLARADRQALIPDLDTVSLHLRQPLAERGKPFEHVYFPLSGVISFVLDLDDGARVEVITTGNEGMAGASVALGSEESPAHVFCQVPGDCLRLKLGTFKAHLKRRPRLLESVLRYNYVVMTQIAQTAACNHVHSIEQRTCRWLLMTHDRAGADQFPLTQEFLAQMLAVRRPSVTVVAGMLQKAGLIQYARGAITIVDRRGLEASACECYARVRHIAERVLGS